MVTWRKLDVQAKVHWWIGEFEGLVFYIEKSKDNFYRVFLKGQDQIGESWERSNTLQEAKEWADNWLCQRKVA
jgi:hypothetical protein